MGLARMSTCPPHTSSLPLRLPSSILSQLSPLCLPFRLLAASPHSLVAVCGCFGCVITFFGKGSGKYGGKYGGIPSPRRTADDISHLFRRIDILDAVAPDTRGKWRRLSEDSWGGNGGALGGGLGGGGGAILTIHEHSEACSEGSGAMVAGSFPERVAWNAAHSPGSMHGTMHPNAGYGASPSAHATPGGVPGGGVPGGRSYGTPWSATPRAFGTPRTPWAAFSRLWTTTQPYNDRPPPPPHLDREAVNTIPPSAVLNARGRFSLLGGVSTPGNSYRKPIALVPEMIGPNGKPAQR